MILIRVVNWSLRSNRAVGNLKLFSTTIDRYHGVYNFLMKRKTSLIWAGLVFSVRVLNIQYSKNIYFFCYTVYFMCLYHIFIDIRHPSHLFHVSMDKKSILYHYTYHCYQTKNAQHKRHVTLLKILFYDLLKIILEFEIECIFYEILNYSTIIIKWFYWKIHTLAQSKFVGTFASEDNLEFLYWMHFYESPCKKQLSTVKENFKI